LLSGNYEITVTFTVNQQNPIESVAPLIRQFPITNSISINNPEICQPEFSLETNFPIGIYLVKVTQGTQKKIRK